MRMSIRLIRSSLVQWVDNMALTSQTIKNLKGGISQQPDILRFPDQGAEQVNGFSSEVAGLQKRPPSVHVARLGEARAFGATPAVHLINRDEREKYKVIFTGSSLRVFDLKGTEYAVHFPEGTGYLTCLNPRNDLKMVTIADYTFIVNRGRMVAEDTTLTHSGYPAENKRAIINIRGGQYGKTFTITINGHVAASHKTPIGDLPAHIDEIDGQFIATRLTELLNAQFTAWGWQTRAGVGQGFIFIAGGTANDEGGNITTLATADGYNNQLMNGFIFDVQGVSKLPVQCIDGYIARVTGEAGSDQDDYYVKYDDKSKVWKETVRQGITQGYLGSTMPHALIRNEDGTFTFQSLTWQTRTCGDDESNPHPSFLGQTISDVFFFRNRLGFLSGENVILSRSGEYFKMYPLSVAAFADTDPIDVAVSSNRISTLQYAVPFSEDLLLWSDQAQFVLGADGILTPDSVRLDLTTEFEVSDKARPFGIGRGVYYIAPRASFSSVRRYYAVQDVSAVRSADDISAHVPSYIQNGVFKMSGSSTENFLLALTEGAPERIYMYKFLYMDEQLKQQSWSHWDFGEGTKVLSAEMVGALLHLILDSPSGIFMETIEFTQFTKDIPIEPYRLYVDRKKVVQIPAGRYDDDTFTTTFTLTEVYGSTPITGRYYVVDTQGTAQHFDPPNGGWPVDPVIRLVGNRENDWFIVGEAYEFRYRFSQFLLKSMDDTGVVTVDTGRFQLRRAWVNYEASGTFTVEVNASGNKYNYTMTGNRLSSSTMLLGNENLDTGQFRFPIQSEVTRAAVTINSSVPSPVSLIGCGFEGVYNKRSQGG